jgi:hypothetical protein
VTIDLSGSLNCCCSTGACTPNSRAQQLQVPARSFVDSNNEWILVLG